MDYMEKVESCKTEKELFELWKRKKPVKVNYRNKNQQVECNINHGNIFISDGIVNEKLFGAEGRKKILYILKEAYGGETDWSLSDELRERSPWSSIWNRVTEWTYGIQNTTLQNIAKYTPELISKEENNPYLNQIAVVNLKKSGGKSKSEYGEIEAYANADKEEIKKQISLIDPDIVICGSTFGIVNRLYENRICPEGSWCDNWYYFTDIMTDRKTLVIDYYHPANYYPALLNYYGVVNIYFQALQEKE